MTRIGIRVWLGRTGEVVGVVFECGKTNLIYRRELDFARNCRGGTHLAFANIFYLLVFYF